jgi:hypothetical protein
MTLQRIEQAAILIKILRNIDPTAPNCSEDDELRYDMARIHMEGEYYGEVREALKENDPVILEYLENAPPEIRGHLKWVFDTIVEELSNINEGVVPESYSRVFNLHKQICLEQGYESAV